MASAINSVNVIFDMVFQPKSHKINNKKRYQYGRNHSRRTACACIYVLSRQKESRVSYVMDVEDVVCEVGAMQLRVCVCVCMDAEIE